MEISLSNDLVMLLFLPFIGLPVAAIWAFVYYLKRRAENKVRKSELILRADIVLLARTNSRLLDDAIALRCAQMEQERNFGD